MNPNKSVAGIYPKMSIRILFEIFRHVMFVLIVIGLFPGVCFAEKIDFEEEGYFEPTVNSEVPFNPTLFSKRGRRSLSQFGIGGSDYQITVNPMKDNFPDMIVYVTLLDSSGNVVTGALEGDFNITEQSTTEIQPTQESLTCFEEAAAGNNGISFALVFDVSGSMKGQQLEDARQSAIDFLNSCGSNDRASLVRFSSSSEVMLSPNWVHTDADGNGDFDIVDSLSDFTADGRTALYDGTAMGIGTLTQEPEPKAVIVFTDGKSNEDHTYNINSLIEYAKDQGISIYTIGLGDNVDVSVLTNMATETGGTYYYAPTAQDMTSIYNDIAKNIRNQYQICYTTHNPEFDGTTRTVTVSYKGSTGAATYRVNARPVVTLHSQTHLLHQASQPPGISISISGIVNDLDAHDLGQNLGATITYSTSNADPATYISSNLTLTGPDANANYNFTFQIPAEYVKEPGIIYYIRATDGIQETFSPIPYDTLPHTIPVLENHTPNIVHTPVTSAPKSQAIDIQAVITDQDAGDSVQNAVLYYRSHNPDQTTPFHSLSMDNSENGNYSAQIPGYKVTTEGLDYFISAWDSHAIRSDNGNSEYPHFIEVRDTGIAVSITPLDNCATILEFRGSIKK